MNIIEVDLIPSIVLPRQPEKTVYLLGAGVNRSTFDFHGRTPPLMHDVFITANRMHNLRESPGVYADTFDFVESEFKIHPSQLFNTEVNWEDCVDRAAEKILSAKNERERVRFELVRLRLIQLLASTVSLAGMEGVVSDVMRGLSQIIWSEKATVLTFNYDTAVEDCLQHSSGFDEKTPPSSPEFTEWTQAYRTWDQGGRQGSPPEPLLGYHRNAWERQLGYGVKFDRLSIPQPGTSSFEVDGKKYYGHSANSFHDLKVLKLHGSLNWFRYTDTPAFSHPSFPGIDSSLTGKLLLLDYGWIPPQEWPRHNNIVLEPLIVTGKDKAEALKVDPFPQLWDYAREALSRATRVVVIGYSFAKSDRKSRELIQDTISKTKPAPRVEWVTPSTKHIYDVTSELGLPSAPVHRRTVEEYVWRHPLMIQQRTPTDFFLREIGHRGI